MGRELRENPEFMNFYTALSAEATPATPFIADAGDEAEEDGETGGHSEHGHEGIAGAGASLIRVQEGQSLGMHPKLLHLEKIVADHFTVHPGSRVIIFSQVNGSINVQMLSPILSAHRSQ